MEEERARSQSEMEKLKADVRSQQATAGYEGYGGGEVVSWGWCRVILWETWETRRFCRIPFDRTIGSQEF